ncbi:predicted protein [Coccidioides posadasii str. Silveira]|uniref:Predicted protein n=1 Tax=Coccidioides posadasii (strain RMSCC 757 / Silveira) TaxID=443226 RepID=E9CTS6_COCPS|nr:predicted protein [Coccidioides posadasii str. Silveira]
MPHNSRSPETSSLENDLQAPHLDEYEGSAKRYYFSRVTLDWFLGGGPELVSAHFKT